MRNDRKTRLIGALAVFAASFFTYVATMAPTLSFWDCGEFIAAANILGIPHPPGTPFFVVLAKAFIDFMPFEDIAMRVNFISALTSALTVMVTFLFMEKLLTQILRDKGSRFSVYVASFAGAALLTFSDTFWFNAVEAEVYGAAMFLVMTISYLSLLWVEHRDRPGSARYLILICYLAFLGVGIHLYTMMTIPAIFVLMLAVDKDTRTNWPLWLTGAALLSVIYDIGDFMWYGMAMLAVALVGVLLTSDAVWRRRWKLCSWLCVVALIGFSTHAYIPIRSALDPRIDENDPETLQAFNDFLERKQYGSESMLRRAFHRRGHPLNQLLTYPHMGYGGYMLAQYGPWKVGELRSEESGHVERLGVKFSTQMELMGDNKSLQMFFFLLLHLPIGYAIHQAWRRNRSLGVYIGLLYAISSLGLVFYMNFADGTRMELRDHQYWLEMDRNPQAKPPPVHLEVRERDYFFTPGFIFMSVLFGMAAGFLLERLRGLGRGMAGGSVKAAGALLVLLGVALPAFSNYREHDRTGMYVPWDYAYNLLQSCRPNSVLFTNGDNDTFPLWFMQEVENVRRDVRVVNLSLVNTNWYIHQLLEHEPKLTLGFTHEEIDRLQPEPWRFKKNVVWKVPNTGINVELEPRSYLKVQDIMVLNIVQNNYPERPIHFAVTVSDDNMMGLQDYLVMEGMVYNLVEEKKRKELNVGRTAHLVDSVYQFRGLGDPRVYIDPNTEGLLTNYSATSFKLISWAQDELLRLDREIEDLKAEAAGDSGAAGDSLENEIAALEAEREQRFAFGEKYLKLNMHILSREWRNYYFGGQFYAAAGRPDKAEEMFRIGLESAPNPKFFAVNLAQIYEEQKKHAQAESLLSGMLGENPSDFELAYALSEVLQRQGSTEKARGVLEEWLQNNPGHQYARVVAEQLRYMGHRTGGGQGPVPGLPGGPPDAPAGSPEAPAGSDGLEPAGDTAARDGAADTAAPNPAALPGNG